jgi:uncharacterized protein (TIGR00251 family)
VGLLVQVRVTPRAQATHVGGATPDGHLQVRVRATPADGAANDEVVAALAGAFGVPRSAVRIVRGATARLKTVAIEGGDPARLTALSAARKGQDTP